MKVFNDNVWKTYTYGTLRDKNEYKAQADDKSYRQEEDIKKGDWQYSPETTYERSMRDPEFKKEYKDAMEGFEEWRDVIDGSDEVRALKDDSKEIMNKKPTWCSDDCPDEIRDLCKQNKQALRNNSDKTKYASLQWNALAEVAKVATHGADKYGNYNYKKGFPLTDLFDSTMRHLIGNPTDSKDGKAHKGFMTGENEDRDSKINHLAHAAWNLLTMLEQELDRETYGKFDDRYKKG